MIELIVFDADHTLYTPRAEEAYRRKFDFLEGETGIPREKIREAWEEKWRAVRESQDPEKRERANALGSVLDELGVSRDREVIDNSISLFWDAVRENIEYDRNIGRTMRSLGERGMKLAIATDEFPDPLSMKLGEVFESPESIFVEVATPAETGIMKPSASFYEFLLGKTGAYPARTMMVGDSWERDLEPAAGLGMWTVLLGEGGEADHNVKSIGEVEGIVEEIESGP